MRLMHSLQLPPAAMHELIQHLSTLSALELAAVTPHTTAMVSELFRRTWFRLDRDSSRISDIYHQGVPPRGRLGGYAVCLFAFSIREKLRKCVEQQRPRNGLAFTSRHTFDPGPPKS